MKITGGTWSKGDAIAGVTLLIAVAGLVAASLAIPGMPKLFHWDKPEAAALQTPAEQTKSTSYVGQVTTEGGAAIPNATVLVTQDETIGQIIRTDSNGQFQVRLSDDTKSLRLSVTAEGYVEAKIQANTHRTGPEEIHLHAITPAHTGRPASGPQKPGTPPGEATPPVVIGGNVTQQSAGACSPNIIGSGNVTTCNPPIPKYQTMTSEQRDALIKALRQYKGRTVQILPSTNGVSSNTVRFQNDIRIATTQALGYYLFKSQQTTSRGISAVGPQKDRDIVSTLSQFLKNNGFIAYDIPYHSLAPGEFTGPSGAILVITIAEPE